MQISILVLTYRRPAKLKRLLAQFTSPEMLSISNLIKEIVIADDCSNDNTLEVIAPILEELVTLGYAARYIHRDKNLRGDMNLYQGYRDDCSAEYVWILCDDDVLIPVESSQFISAVIHKLPAVAICQFAQGRRHKYGTKFAGESRRIFDTAGAIEMIIRFPKTSAYILKRDLIEEFDQAIHDWNGTLYSWIGMSIMLFTQHQSQGLYVHTPLTIVGDKQYASLRYSYRIFKGLGKVVEDAIEKSNYSCAEILLSTSIKKRSEMNWCVRGLCSHINPFNPVRYEKDIFTAELKFLTKDIFMNIKKNFINYAKKINMFMKSIGIDLTSFVAALFGLPNFICNLVNIILVEKKGWQMRLLPTLSDRYKSAGVASGHYFHMDLWAARKVYALNPQKIVDVGSRVDGFISHLLSFREIEIFDIRDLQSKVSGLKFRRLNIMDTNGVPEAYSDCVSSLHAIEHFGLGRYGDPIDIDGWKKGIDSLAKILKAKGTLILAVPISGLQRIDFDAHRVFKIETIIDYCAARGLELSEFSYVDDQGEIYECSLPIDHETKILISSYKYGCGCFEFIKL